jgi:Helix-turn-helix domain
LRWQEVTGSNHVAPTDLELTGMVDTRVSNQGGDPVTEQQLLRIARRRLAILRHAEEITGNVSLTCRYYGISRQCFYTWRRRYDAHGLDGLRDRSHRPQISPNATRTEVVGKILYLRQHYHFGPARIAMYPGALPPGPDQQLGRVAHPQAAGAQPPAGLPAAQAPRPALEAL